jgi:alkylation response protein AidB-like acyl-CoA dehydrogenase
MVDPPDLTAAWRTPDRWALVTGAREVAARLRPRADELDRSRSDLPADVIEEMGERGYFGVLIPREHGGLGQGVLEYCLVSEELSRAWLSAGSILARGQGFGTGVADATRRGERLSLSAAGRWIGAAAFSEPEAGSDLGAITTTATVDGDGLILTGHKGWCGNAVGAHFIVVMCRLVDGSGSGQGPIRTVLVEKEPGTVPSGMTATPIYKIGYHGMTTYDLHLQDVRVPSSAVIEAFAAPGAGGHDFAAVERGLNIARVQTAARAVVLARAAVEDTAAYLLHREQFGRPLASFQAVRFQLAEMAARMRQARSFYLDVAASMDAGDLSQVDAAMVKLTATEVAVDVTGQALHLHGGNGYTTEHSVERYWRDARLTTIFEGTSEIQQLIISDLLGKVRP